MDAFMNKNLMDLNELGEDFFNQSVMLRKVIDQGLPPDEFKRVSALSRAMNSCQTACKYRQADSST
ncbi:MAG: hypothetical protein K6A65_03605 [Succinivibrionaceae bacterium]|nr:hypothetical protein [Succinivibrionaceae bacterium]